MLLEVECQAWNHLPRSLSFCAWDHDLVAVLEQISLCDSGLASNGVPIDEHSVGRLTIAYVAVGGVLVIKVYHVEFKVVAGYGTISKILTQSGPYQLHAMPRKGSLMGLLEASEFHASGRVEMKSFYKTSQPYVAILHASSLRPEMLPPRKLRCRVATGASWFSSITAAGTESSTQEDMMRGRMRLQRSNKAGDQREENRVKFHHL